MGKNLCEGNRVIKTARLIIRRVRADDWKAIQEVWEDEAKSRYAQYDRPNDLDDQAVCGRITMWSFFANGDEHIFYAVCLKERVIGYVSLNRTEGGYEIGYCFHSYFHGKGYAKESISGILEDLKSRGMSGIRITAGTALENTPSVRLLLSLGFNQAGTEKVSFYKDDDGNNIIFDGGVYELLL